MSYVLGVFAVLFLVFMIVGAVTGRVRASACCAVADPAQDLRMRAAFETPAEIGADDRG